MSGICRRLQQKHQIAHEKEIGVHCQDLPKSNPQQGGHVYPRCISVCTEPISLSFLYRIYSTIDLILIYSKICPTGFILISLVKCEPHFTFQIECYHSWK